MGDVFRKLENPALVDLQLRWPDGVTAALAAGLPSDVYAGDPLTVVAKVSSVPRCAQRSPAAPAVASGLASSRSER